MNYEKLKALTQRKSHTPPRRAGAGYEEAPENPTQEDLERFDAVLRGERRPVKRGASVRVTKPRRVAA